MLLNSNQTPRRFSRARIGSRNPAVYSVRPPTDFVAVGDGPNAGVGIERGLDHGIAECSRPVFPVREVAEVEAGKDNEPHLDEMLRPM